MKAHAFVELCGALLICGACAHAGEATMTNNPPQSHREQRPPPGLSKQLEAMKAEADQVVLNFKTRLMLADQRHREAVFELFAVMRPRFGPANAQLFHEREKKLVELARALGAQDPMPPDLDAHRLDRYFDSIERAAEALRSRGLQVEITAVSSAVIDWKPTVPGRILRATDPTRMLPEFIAYPELMPEPPKPRNAPPRVTLYLFPPAPMHTLQRMMTREQPGELFGALDGACVFRLQAPQSGDTDDGKTTATVTDSLFPGAKAVEEPKLAATLGVQTAERLRGALRITAETPPPAPGFPGLPKGVEVVLWSVPRGGEIEHAVIPTQ